MTTKSLASVEKCSLAAQVETSVSVENMEDEVEVDAHGIHDLQMENLKKVGLFGARSLELAAVSDITGITTS